MNEDMIERIVERKMDSLDHQLMDGLCTQAEYDRAVRILEQWADDEYENIRRYG